MAKPPKDVKPIEPIQCELNDILAVLSVEEIGEIVARRVLDRVAIPRGGSRASKLSMDMDALIMLATTAALMGRGEWPEDSEGDWILEGAKEAGIISEYWRGSPTEPIAGE